MFKGLHLNGFSLVCTFGPTTHKIFGLKLPLSSDLNSSIRPGSNNTKELAQVNNFLIYEVPMLPKYGLRNMDKLLRSVANPNLAFGRNIWSSWKWFSSVVPFLMSGRSLMIFFPPEKVLKVPIFVSLNPWQPYELNWSWFKMRRNDNWIQLH